MNEHEVKNGEDAAFFLANEVVNEYHAFPVVQRADLGKNMLYIKLGTQWYRITTNRVLSGNTTQQLEDLIQ
jgi:hypothetical protein